MKQNSCTGNKRKVSFANWLKAHYEVLLMILPGFLGLLLFVYYPMMGSVLAFKDYKMPVAGKTGTASNNNDLWFCGYTPYYTASVWSGFDNNFSQINQSYQQDIWRTIMERIHEEKALPYKEFTVPDSVATAKICTKSGKLAINGLCDLAEGGSTVRTEYFAKGTVPLEKCDVHIKASICSASGKASYNLS